MTTYPLREIILIDNDNGHSLLIEKRILSDGRVEVVTSKNVKTEKLSKVWKELQTLISE